MFTRLSGPLIVATRLQVYDTSVAMGAMMLEAHVVTKCSVISDSRQINYAFNVVRPCCLPIFRKQQELLTIMRYEHLVFIHFIPIFFFFLKNVCFLTQKNFAFIVIVIEFYNYFRYCNC